MTAHDKILAALSEGVCPACNSKLDKNRVCASGVKWDIKPGEEISQGHHYEGKDHIKNCIKCMPPSKGLWQIIPANVDYADIETKLVGTDIKFTVNVDSGDITAAAETLRKLYAEINKANLTDGDDPFNDIHVDYYKDES